MLTWKTQHPRIAKTIQEGRVCLTTGKSFHEATAGGLGYEDETPGEQTRDAGNVARLGGRLPRQEEGAQKGLSGRSVKAGFPLGQNVGLRPHARTEQGAQALVALKP